MGDGVVTLRKQKAAHHVVRVKSGRFSASRVAPQDFIILSQQFILRGQDFSFPEERNTI